MTEPEELEEALARRRAVWPYFAGFTVALLLAAGGWLMWPQSPAPYRVLLVPHGVEGEPADRLVAAIRGPLAVGGFRVIEVHDGPLPEEPEGARRLAHEAHAQHSVFATVEVVSSRPRGALEPAYVHLRARAVVGDVSGAPAVDVAPVEIASFGSTETEALTDAASRAGEALADAVHLALIQRPSVATFLEDTSIATDEISTQAAMRSAHDRVERVLEEQRWMSESCEEAEEALAAEAGPASGTCLSGACAEEYAFDLLPDGSAALVHGETPSVRVPLVGELVAAERVESVERIDLVPLDGSERRTIATADNYYTYPSLSADGRRVAVVEEWPRGFGLVVIDVETSERTVLARFDRYVQSPRLSPDGEQLIASVRATRRAPAQLVAIRAQVGSSLRLLGESHLARWVRVGVPDAPDPASLIAELVPMEEEEDEALEVDSLEPDAPEEPEEPELADGELPPLDLERRLAVIDPEDGSVRATMEDDRRRVRRVIGSRDGAVVFTWYNGRVCGLGRWDPATGEAEHRVTPVCLRHAHLAADGRAVGTAPLSAEADPEEGDDEIVELGFDDQPARILTANAQRERYPRASAQGRRVIYDRLGTSRYRAFPRVALCWLER